MRRTLFGAAVAGLLTVGAARADAQVSLVLGGGVTLPLSDYKNVVLAQTGWMAIGGVWLSFPLLPVELRADGLYGSNSHEGPGTDKTSLYGGLANVIFNVGIPLIPVKPYIIGGVGYLNHHFSPGNQPGSVEDEWKFAFGVGGGVSVGLAGVGAFVEARYVKRDSDALVPVLVGIRIGG